MLLTSLGEDLTMGHTELHNKLRGLSPEDKLRMLEFLWESMSRQDLERAPLTSAELDELDRRVAAYRDNPAAGVSLQDLDDFLDAK